MPSDATSATVADVGAVGVPHDSTPVDAALVQQLDDEVAESIRSDLAGDGRLQPEPRERTRRVQRAAAALELDLAGEAERAARRQLVDRTADDVGDEDPEADDVHPSILPRASECGEVPTTFIPKGGSMTLEGKVALVTGASRGIGAAVARKLDECGVKLGLASRQRRRPRPRRRCAALRRARSRAARVALVAATVARFGKPRHPRRERRRRRIRPVPRPVARASRRDDRRQPQGDALRGARGVAAPPSSPARRDIVTVASEAGRRGLPFEATYCASKFGQVGFTRALDHELREHGVRCTNVCPGGVATDFALDEGRGRTPEALPGMMTADDVAEVVVFVLTRPRNHRILETAFRPVTEASWG